MKKNFTLIFFAFVSLAFSQAGAPATPYYNGFNWTLTGMSLKSALETKITSTHTKFLTYAEAEDAIKIIDLDPNDVTNTYLFLVYGFSSNVCTYVSESNFGNSLDDNDHRRRHKEADSGAQNCAWNREHTYPRALGTPNLEDNEANADVHHLRAADVARNGLRDNNKFIDGNGNSFESGILWYPGDEWKGDVARMMMYMYLRYGSQCLPTGVAQTGIATAANDSNMVQLFLEWNAEDPVSQYEDNRNTYLGNTANTYAQGNRNPFIDNPYLATVIWGGPQAENRWPTVFVLATDTYALENSLVYPNPAVNNEVYVTTSTELKTIILYNVNGQIIQEIKNPSKVENNAYKVSNLPTGFYIMQLASENASTIKKLIVN
ncbi:endonuclease [Flavobacterium psychraquaticum]|uniref:endonuclease n=1 Tax=Flavobacterium psychraquaticum TaxID=3103958 RepID=UPI002ACE9385|nr:endonuclease [Flavobacterium sp. LB-N7T]